METSFANAAEAEAGGSPRATVVPRSRRGCLIVATLAGALAGLGSILLLVALRGRDLSPELTRARFESAAEKWDQAAHANYRIEIKVVGPQPALYSVEVRAGEVISSTIDNRPLKQRRTFDTWSVPGMFNTIERDLANVDLAASGRATKETPRLTLRADFDREYGYPRRYRRIEWGSGRDMTWQVTKFELIADGEVGLR